MRKILIVVATLAVASCASETRLPAPVQASISARHIGQIIELKQSMYYGDLYDENEMWLLSPYPFADTYHIVDPRGAPIHPQGQRGLFPAGSRFVVQKIEFPDVTAMAKRMLTSPRYNPWVYLTPGEGTIAPEGRKYFILVLPMDLDDEHAVESALAALVAPNGEVTRWLSSIRPTARAAIENKDVVPGMSIAELTAAMGDPQRLLSDQTPSGAHVTVAWYPSKEAWIVDGKVAEVRPGRQIDQKPVTTPAPVATPAEGSATPAAAAEAHPSAATPAQPAADTATQPAAATAPQPAAASEAGNPMAPEPPATTATQAAAVAATPAKSGAASPGKAPAAKSAKAATSAKAKARKKQPASGTK